MNNSGRWEYKIAHTTDGSLFSGDASPMEGTLSSLGGDGWELVDTITDSRGASVNSGQMAFVFRRSKRWDAERHLTGTRERPALLMTHHE